MDKDDKQLVIKLGDSLSAGIPRATRIVARMVSDSLVSIQKQGRQLTSSRYPIGNYEFNDPDYRQLLLWSEKSGLSPLELVQKLEHSVWLNEELEIYIDLWPDDCEFQVLDGSIISLVWDFTEIPIIPNTWVDGLSVQRIFMTGFDELSEEEVFMPDLGELEFRPKLKHLSHLYCKYTRLTSLDLSSIPSLTELVCLNNYKITKLDLSAIPSLTKLICISSKLNTLDLSAIPLLNQLDCIGVQLTEIDLSYVPSLTKLNCSFNQLTELDLSAVTSLKELNCSINQLTKLELTAVELLTELDCSFNKLSDLDLSPVPSLIKLECSDNQLSELDLSPIKKKIENANIWCQFLLDLRVDRDVKIMELHGKEIQINHGV